MRKPISNESMDQFLSRKRRPAASVWRSGRTWRTIRILDFLEFHKEERLCRLMCGKALPFRQVPFEKVAARLSLAAVKESEGHLIFIMAERMPDPTKPGSGLQFCDFTPQAFPLTV
jgi:hypothetical protein